MKTAKPTPLWHSAGRDLQHDWDAWSLWEQRAVTVVSIAACAAGLFWLAISISLLG
jgi:hypothetical protein